MAVSVSSLFSAARLFKRQVFNVMFKNSGFENKGLAKPGLSVSEKWTKSSLERVLKVPRHPLEADERVLSEKRKAPSSPKKSTFTRIGYVINVTSNIVFQAFKTRS